MIPLCATGRFRRPIHGPQMPSLFFFFFPQMPSQTNQHCHSHTHPIYASGKANITYTTTLSFLGPQPNFVDCRAKHVTTSSGMWRTSSGRLNSIYGVCLFVLFFFGHQLALCLLTQIHCLALAVLSDIFFTEHQEFCPRTPSFPSNDTVDLAMNPLHNHLSLKNSNFPPSLFRFCPQICKFQPFPFMCFPIWPRALSLH